LSDFNNGGFNDKENPLQQENSDQNQNQEQRPIPPDFRNNQNNQYQQGYGQQPNQNNQYQQGYEQQLNQNNQYQQGNIQPPVFESPKRALKKDANKTSGLLLIMQAGIGVIVAIAMAIVGFVLASQLSGDNLGQLELTEKLTTKLTELTTGGIGMILLGMFPVFLVSVIIILISRKWFKISLRRDLFTKPQQSKNIFLLAPLAVMGVGAIGGFITQIYLYLFEKAEIPINMPDFSFPENDLLGSILMVVYVCILAPLTEEIIFRGIILKTTQKHGDLYAIILSSIMFSLFHGNLQQFIFPFFMGLLLGFITVKTRSIIPAIVCHAFSNSFSMATQYFVVDNKIVSDIVPFFITILSILVFILFTVIYAKDIKSISRGDTSYMKTGKKLVAGLTSAWSIVFIAIYVLGVALPILMNIVTSKL